MHLVLSFFFFFLCFSGKGTARKQIQLHKIGDANDTDFHYQHVQGRDNDLKAQDFFIDLETLNLATSNFSDSNILGQGGFGPVYKVSVLF